MTSIARFVLRHRWWVIAFWAVTLMAGGIGAGQVADRLSGDTSLPGQEGSETEQRIGRSYGVAAEVSVIPVLTAPEGTTIDRAAVTAVADQIRQIPGSLVLDYGGTGDRAFLTGDGRSTFLLVYGGRSGQDDPVAEAVAGGAGRSAADQAGYRLQLTGDELLSEGNAAAAEEPSVLSETLLGGAGALVVLLFVFASFLALVPLLIAAVAILSTFLLVLVLTTFADVSFMVQFLVALIGLGVAIDYSLLVVTRWREERSRGAANAEAVIIAVGTAGRAVFASGVTVAISLAALVVLPVPAVRSMGYGGMLIPLVSTLVVLTLLPAVLSLVGPRVDWPRIRTETHASRGWSAWARTVIRHRWVAATAALAGLTVAMIPVFGMQIGEPSADSLATKGAAHEALTALRDGGVGSGVLTPMVVLVRPGGDTKSIVDATERVPGVRAAVAAPVAPDGHTEVVVVPEQETKNNTSIDVVTAVRDATKSLPGYVGVAGAGAIVLDWQSAVYDNFWYVLVVIALVTFVLLVRSFRSILLPLKAVLLNLFSVAVVFGLTTWFWQEGNGSEALFGVPATGAMTFWVPVVIFAFLFGLSMDYEVFILHRMREEYDRTGSTSAAVEEGLGRTGRLVTSAALILFFSFAALASTPQTDVKVLATALGAGILLDATIVRALLVPALVSLFGRWNWWLPTWVARLLRVEPSPVRVIGAPKGREPVGVG